MIDLKLEPCLPPVWARSGHLQTILGHLLPSPMLHEKGKPIRIPLEDGDQLAGHLLAGESSTVVYLFHGLAGSTDSTYIHRTARLALKQGHSVIMVNHRGCGDGAGLAKGPYHSGRAEDLGAVIAFGRKVFPKHKHLAVGFSLSGNALLLLLSGRRGKTLPDFAISVNAPVDLHSTSQLLNQGLNKIYDVRFFLECRHGVLYQRHPDAKPYSLPRFQSLRDFDNSYTAPAAGFRDREEYYSTCSTWNLLSEITTPTLILTAHDDPFVDRAAYLRAQPSKAVTLHIEPHGGHMGYLTKSRTPLGSNRWQDYAIDKAIRAFL